jgi:adenylate kinase
MNRLRSPGETESNNRIMVLTGVSGSGKDHLIRRVVSAGLMPQRVRAYSFGQLLFEQAQATYPELRTRDDLKTMLTQEQVEAEASGIIGRLIAAQPALVNTHVVYRQGDTLAINPDVEEEMQASHYVYVKAEPAQIVGWRNRDTSRTRPPETASQIGLHQEIALGVIHAIAQHVGAELITINNHPDDIGTNLATMHEALEAL